MKHNIHWREGTQMEHKYYLFFIQIGRIMSFQVRGDDLAKSEKFVKSTEKGEGGGMQKQHFPKDERGLRTHAQDSEHRY